MFQRFYDDGLAQASFLLWCPRSREALVIDPRRDVDAYVTLAREQGLRILYSIETHIHADFACGSRELAAVGARTLCGPGSRLLYAHHEVSHGERMRVGDISIEFMHTPGHTPEHISILTNQVNQPTRVFTGDTLFAGAVGRPDLLGEEATRRLAGELYESLFNRLLLLDPRIEVHPGHGSGSLCGAGIKNDPFTTIGEEKRSNPMLQHTGKEAFVAAVLADLPDTPPYFPRMKKLNQEGPPLLGLVNPYRGPAAITPQTAAASMRAGAWMIDIRQAADFAASHPRNAVHLAHGPKLGYWAGYVIPTDARVVLMAPGEREAADAARQLIRVGISKIEGQVRGGFEAWTAAGLPTASMPLASVNELHGTLLGSDAPFVVDVRTKKEFDAGHIDGALHLPLGDLMEKAKQLPRDRPVATICEGGYRSSLAASVLAKAGVERLLNVTGGMAAWRNLHPASQS